MRLQTLLIICGAVTFGLTQVSFGDRSTCAATLDGTARVVELIKALRSRNVEPEEVTHFMCGLPDELSQLQPFLKDHRSIIDQELACSVHAIDRIWAMYLHAHATKGKSLTSFIQSEPEPVARLYAYDLLVLGYEGRQGAEWGERELFETIKSCLFSQYAWLRWRALVLWEKTRACLETTEGRKLLAWVIENDPSESSQHVARMIAN